MVRITCTFSLLPVSTIEAFNSGLRTHLEIPFTPQLTLPLTSISLSSCSPLVDGRRCRRYKLLFFSSRALSRASFLRACARASIIIINVEFVLGKSGIQGKGEKTECRDQRLNYLGVFQNWTSCWSGVAIAVRPSSRAFTARADTMERLRERYERSVSACK